MANPQTWPPYNTGTDCSVGYCTIYCPQWCFFYFPPPPPPSHSNFTLSPLLVAIIVLISSAFFIVTAYLISLKYCNNHRQRSQTLATSPTWLPSPSTGLDPSLINKLTIYHYQRSHDNVDTDCSVCLSQFHDGDCLRLLPKCSHAFHKSCIDTWLSSHSNCPLCRSGVIDQALLTVDLEEERRSTLETIDGNDGDVVIEMRDEENVVGIVGESSDRTISISLKRCLSTSGGSSNSFD